MRWGAYLVAAFLRKASTKEQCAYLIAGKKIVLTYKNNTYEEVKLIVKTPFRKDVQFPAGFDPF